MNRFRRADDRRAVAVFEFALVLPILLLLLLAGTDLTVWFINKFRLDNTATQVGDIVTEQNTLALSAFPAGFCSGTSATLNFFAIAYTIAQPLSVCGTGGATIISGITDNGTKTTMVWQKRTGNTAAYPSLIGTPETPTNIKRPLVGQQYETSGRPEYPGQCDHEHQQ